MTHDPAALEALRRSTTFHENFTWPDGTPVETVNDRNRYWQPSMWAHFGFSNFEDGRRYAEFLSGYYNTQPFSLENLGRIAQDALYYHDGPARLIPQDKADYAYRMRVPAMMRESSGWTVCVSGIVSTRAQTNQFYLDRQGNLSVFHERLRLIVTGANSKRQPELGTFSERFDDVVNALPLSSRLDTSGTGDRLALAYNTFFAELKMHPATKQSIAFDVSVTPRSKTASRQIAFQLYLQPGQFLETQAGTSVLLGENDVHLAADQIGGWIRHNGWTFHVPLGTRLDWPVRPFNPYANAPETTIEHAVGVATRPLEARSETLSYSLEAN